MRLLKELKFVLLFFVKIQSLFIMRPCFSPYLIFLLFLPCTLVFSVAPVHCCVSLTLSRPRSETQPAARIGPAIAAPSICRTARPLLGPVSLCFINPSDTKSFDSVSYRKIKVAVSAVTSRCFFFFWRRFGIQ